MADIHEFPPRKQAEKSDPADSLAFFTHTPRFPASQSVGGAVVGQVIVHPSSPDQSRKHMTQSKREDTGAP